MPKQQHPGIARLEAARFLTRRIGYKVIERTLRYWEQHGLLAPKYGGGRGIRTIYRLSDIVAASVVVTLRRDGASLQRVRRAMVHLRRLIPSIIDAPHAWRLAVTGAGEVVRIENNGTLLELTNQPGQVALSIINVGALAEDARKLIEEQEAKKHAAVA
jgi:DNA-binding transcriptional MerR regulator